VREAAIKALTYPTTAYKDGFVPPGAINWNDADDNNAFHAKQIVMDLDGTISTEVAVLSQGKKEDYNDIVTMGLALRTCPEIIESTFERVKYGFTTELSYHMLWW
jgi:multiple sugar transport system substrate-binding protein